MFLGTIHCFREGNWFPTFLVCDTFFVPLSLFDELLAIPEKENYPSKSLFI